jgi:hypothetical protein
MFTDIGVRVALNCMARIQLLVFLGSVINFGKDVYNYQCVALHKILQMFCKLITLNCIA